MSVQPTEVYYVLCDAFSPRCMFRGAHDSASETEAITQAKKEGWRSFGDRVTGLRHKCPECVKARAKLT